jgi:GNAT superfamily N-acetyltransferase
MNNNTLVKINEDGYSLHHHDHIFDAKLAVMWNESDDQWPGTFTKGVPMTEKSVSEWMDRVTAIVKYIVVAPDGAVVGFGDLWDSLQRPKSAYVAVLNVHPLHQGKSLARMMLSEMVDWASENGYDRLSIGTWPANLKSVPLYKKVGFFWQPGTNVHMENYIPAVRQLPIAQDYFTRNSWYHTYVRELAQVEDDMRHPKMGEMKVYVLRWKSGEEFIEAVFDRNGQSITGFSTPQFSAFTRVDQSELAQGVAYPVFWEIENHKDSPISVSIMASGDPGISLKHREIITLNPGEKRTLTGEFRCSTEAPSYEIDDLDLPTPKLKTLMVIDGQTLEFGTGVRYRPAVEVSLGPWAPTFLPGKPQALTLQMHNRVGRDIKGTITIQPQSNMKIDPLRHGFKAVSDGFIGLPVTVTAEEPGETPLIVTVSFKDGEDTVSTAPNRIPLMALQPGGLAAGTGEDEFVLENEFFRLMCKPKGGDALIWNKADQRKSIQILEELGEPFVPWELNSKDYDLSLERGDGCLKLKMEVESDRFRGIHLTREITMTASPLVEIHHEVTNNSLTTQSFQVRPALRSKQQGLQDVITPLKQRIIIENTGEFLISTEDVPEDPSKLAQPWIAFQGNGQVSGVIWLQELDKIMAEWGQLFLFGKKVTLEPQESLVSGKTYIYEGPGDWRQVQRTWQRLAGEPISYVPLAPQPAAKRYFDVGLTPLPMVTLSDQLATTLFVTNTRKFKLTGSVTVDPPRGWEVDHVDHDIPEVCINESFEAPLIFTTNKGSAGAFEGQLHLKTQLFDHVSPFSILRLGDETASVTLNNKKVEGQEVWQISNGRCSWELAPDFHGGVVSWRECEKEINHLLTSFPGEGELSWMKPWFGGLRPTLNNPQQDEGWPGKLHTETFYTEGVKMTDRFDLSWEGVRFSSQLALEAFHGIKAEINYLTLGGSNLFKVIYRLVNQTNVFREVEPSLMTFLQVDGSHKDTVLHTKKIQRKRTQQMAWINGDAWAAAENPDTGRVIAVVNASGWRRVQLLDWGVDGGHFNCYEIAHLPPESTYEMVMYLALATSLDEAKLYRVLGGL